MPDNVDIPRAGPRLAIGAIFKNEAPYILEWVAYHRAVGIDRFFIADNNSDDGTTELLRGLDDLGLVDHISFPGKQGQPPQIAAYEEIMRRHARDADWIAFIDADEFIVATAETSFRDFVTAIAERPEVGAIALNWAIYGSSFHEQPTDGLVLERFDRRAEKDHPTNSHYKSIVRSDAYVSTHLNPHLFRLRDRAVAVHADGMTILDSPRGPGISTTVVWSQFRLNHYVVKSKAEFLTRKRARGRATTVDSVRSEAFFIGHDRNEVKDGLAPALVEGVRASVERLTAELIAKNVKTDYQAAREPLSPVPTRNFRGCVDRAHLLGPIVEIIGWACDEQGRPATHLAVAFGGTRIEDSIVRRTQRRDVQNAVAGASLDCGFVIRILMSDVVEAGRPPDLEVFVGDVAAPSPAYRLNGQTAWAALVAGLPSDAQSPAAPRVTAPHLSRLASTTVIRARSGNVGNQMFRYMLAARIAEQLGDAIISGCDFPQWDMSSAPHMSTNNLLHIGPIHRVDIQEVAYALRSGLFDGVDLEAYGQRMEYFFDRRDQFNRTFSSAVTGTTIGDGEIAINVRSNEILAGLHRDYMPLPITYYQQICEETGLSPVFVGQVGDSEYVRRLRAAFPTARFFAGQHWIDDFQTIRKAKNVVLAISTFSWLAAWLSETASRIYLPIMGIFNPEQRPDIDLLPFTDARYVFDEFPIFPYVGSSEQLALLTGSSVLSTRLTSEALQKKVLLSKA